ncbi:hypothetical protein J3R83DRAFT_12532 [Lanmaoa asiatica]|nr:hypothetical protein J3R83DRAFT_12532 [Lanmaoa asiatica]
MALLDYLEEDNLDPNEGVDDAQQPRVTLIWRVPLDLTIDPTTTYARRASAVNFVPAKRVLPPQNGFLTVNFDTEAIELLRSPTAWLDDVCINGCIALLFASIRPDNWTSFAVFSTHDLP